MIPSFVDAFERTLSRLETADIPHMIVGSLASTVYGEPRLTHDLDIVLNIPPEKIQTFVEAFSDIDLFYCPPLEIIRSEATRCGQFNLLDQASGLKIDCIIQKDTPHGRTEFERRRKVEFFKGFNAWIASPEDVIIKKLSFHRDGGSPKHLRDIRGILNNQDVDQTYLDHWIDTLELQGTWEKVN